MIVLMLVFSPIFIGKVYITFHHFATCYKTLYSNVILHFQLQCSWLVKTVPVVEYHISSTISYHLADIDMLVRLYQLQACILFPYIKSSYHPR